MIPQKRTIDRQVFAQAVENNGSVVGTARELGVSETLVRRWLKEFGLETKSATRGSYQPTIETKAGFRPAPDVSKLAPLYAGRRYEDVILRAANGRVFKPRESVAVDVGGA